MEFFSQMHATFGSILGIGVDPKDLNFVQMTARGLVVFVFCDCHRPRSGQTVSLAQNRF